MRHKTLVPVTVKKALGNNLTAAEILSGMSESMIGRLIDDYNSQENGDKE